MTGVEQYPWDVNVLRCGCGPHNGPVMKFTIDTKGISFEDTNRLLERLKESMNRKPLINSETGDTDYKYIPREVMQDLFIPIEADDNAKLVGDFSLVGNMQAPSNFSEEAKEEFYKQLKNTYGDKFDKETKQLRMDNLKVDQNTGGI